MRPTKAAAAALVAAALVSLSATGQPPPGGFPKGPKGLKGKADTSTERLLDDLNLSDAQRRQARDLLRAHDDRVKAAVSKARQELLAEMKGVIPDDEYQTFQAELAAVPLLPPVPPILRTVTDADLLDRLMGYDKNGDGRVTADELPERMHGLLGQGDRNRDGALDRDELTRLAERPPPGQKGPPPGGKGFPGDKGFPGGKGFPGDKGFPGRP